ncbi:MAG TPA: ornithine carbamoyltransferase [Candidatus Brocadiia bacterium]|nr:ornithine carbamoyltransferase [Candidatus Brocadiia bacterium]
MRHLVSLNDFTGDEIRHMLEESIRLKKLRRENALAPLPGKPCLALIFEKSSMRTRVSFDVAIHDLGGYSIYLSRQDINLGSRESFKDAALVLSRYVNCVAARTFEQNTVEELARYSDVPVINALSDMYHPCQALADILTALERFGTLKGVKLAFIGDGNNVARSLAVICAKLGMDYAIASPDGYELDEPSLKLAKSYAAKSGSRIEQVRAPGDAASGARVLYTDTWVSMGQEKETEKRLKDFKGYCIDSALLKAAAPDAIVMHCLPAHRGLEITDEVMDGPQSVVLDEAENRLHAQRAVLKLLLSDWRS